MTNAFNPAIGKWLDPLLNTGTTIFNRLEEAGIPWRVYYDERQLVSLTGMLHAPHLEKYWTSHFRTMTTFYRDVAERHPARLQLHRAATDLRPQRHASAGRTADSHAMSTAPSSRAAAISDVRAGEALLHRVYTAIRESSTATDRTRSTRP